MKLFKAIAQGGPVGFAHTLREAWIAHRLRRARNLMESERALHRVHMAQLRAEIDHLELHQIRITHRAASFWKALS
jgi:hypothetical protein